MKKLYPIFTQQRKFEKENKSINSNRKKQTDFFNSKPFDKQNISENFLIFEKTKLSIVFRLGLLLHARYYWNRKKFFC